MGSHGTCGSWVLLDWLDDADVEKKFGKLDNLALDLYLNKETTLGKPNDAKLDPESNYTFAKKPKIMVCIWNLEALEVALCGA